MCYLEGSAGYAYGDPDHTLWQHWQQSDGTGFHVPLNSNTLIIDDSYNTHRALYINKHLLVIKLLDLVFNNGFYICYTYCIWLFNQNNDI